MFYGAFSRFRPAGRALLRVSALRASIGARVRRFVRRHPAVTLFATLAVPIIVLDRLFDLHALAMVLAIYVGLSFADAWDQETR